MVTPHAKPSYIRVYEHEGTPASNTSTHVELRSLHDERTSDEAERKTEITHSTARQTSLPLQGPAALLAIVILTDLAVGVLLVRRGSPIERWRVENVKVQPQVWLSVLSTIMDGLTMFAAAKAAEMIYWRTASRGTTLRQMYDLYESQAILGALKNIFRLRGNQVVAVFVIYLLSALRGPLFQRASMVDSNSVHHIVGKQELKVAQLIPPNYLYQNGVGDRMLFDSVYIAYTERAPIHVNTTNKQTECGDSCEGKVKVRASVPQSDHMFKLTRSRATAST